METITTVKLTKDGYRVNGEYDVPNSPGNRDYNKIQKWLEANTAEPMYDFEETKAKKLEELDKQYNDKTVRTVVYNTNNVIVNNASLNGIQNKITLVTNNTVTSINWYFDDGNIDTLIIGDLKELQILIANKDQLLRDIKYAHQITIEAYTDVDLLDAHDVTAGINSLSWSL